MEGGENDKNLNDGWWRTANLGECPITLESFSTLAYPPFALYHSRKAPATATADGIPNSDGVVSTYFDGLALASYIVSRGVFQNPLTRIELVAEDCRRLDRYLEDYCYSSNAATAATIFRGSRVISVAEAFALRNSVSVEIDSMGSDQRQSNNNNISNERDRERIRVLQNVATAALAGLFVYGNDRRGHRTNDIALPNNNNARQQIRDETSFLLNEWGFDLSRRMEETASHGTHGYTVIDDDEAVAVASQRQAYETVQEAFPRLDSKNPRGCQSGSIPTVTTDDRLMEHIRALSVRDQTKQRQHARELEKARELLLRQALERRSQRQKDRADRLARQTESYVSRKKDEAELESVRVEIEAWRDDQWEKLKLLSERGQRNNKERQSISVSKSPERTLKCDSREDGHRSDEGKAETTVNGETIHDVSAEEKKKAKAAAKRKRAKERKKAKKASDKEEAEKLRLNQAAEAQRAASALKCGACGTGVLKLSLAFERFDQLFCSPKCARTAVRVVPG